MYTLVKDVTYTDILFVLYRRGQKYMTKKNVIICFNPHNSKGNTVIPSSIVREFAYSGEESKPTQEKKHYGVVTIKDIKKFSDFFEQNHVPIEMIHRLLSEFQAQIRVKERCITVFCKSDRWRISLIDKDQVLLEHNNYKKNQYGGRYFEPGYHTQRTTSFKDALEYIMNYDYKQMHFPVAQKKLKKALEESLVGRYEVFFENKEKLKKNIRGRYEIISNIKDIGR